MSHPWNRMLEPDSQPRFFRALMQCSHSLSVGAAAGAEQAGVVGGGTGGVPREMAVAAEVRFKP